MLQHVRHSFEFPGSIPPEARTAVISYAGLLVSHGYVARKFWLVDETPHKGIIGVAGIGCAPQCLAIALADERIASAVNDICTTYGAKGVVEYTIASGTLDEHYAPDPPWEALQLVCDCILGISPLRTVDGRVVARCMPQLASDLARDLWTWDVEYDAIYACYLAGGAYETWAERELTNAQSGLNETGRALAARLSQALACPVAYSQHERQS